MHGETVKSRLVLLRIRNVSDKSSRENQNTVLHNFISDSCFPSRKSCRLWKKYGRPGHATEGNKIRRIRVACWI